MKLTFSIAATTILLSLLGIVMIYSASSYSALRDFGDEFFYVKKQAIAFAAGLVMMLVGSKFNVQILQKIKWIVLIAAVILLGLVFVPGLGVESYGATRWLNLGFTTVQPSEFAKFALMIFLSGYLSENPPKNFVSLIVPLVCGLGICTLIILEPNMSITICVGLALLVMLFVAGTPKKWFVLLFLCLAAAVPLLIILEPYRMKRFTAFVNPWENPKAEGYQLIQSYFALGGGGLFGTGLFRSRQKYLFLPFAESDFIFSVIGEELGLFGCLAVIAMFVVLIFCGIKVALRTDSFYKTLLATGIISVIALQTVINMAVVTGTIPPTGLPLPFVSFGGTALMTYMFSSGLLINIASPLQKANHKM
ncbi:MAG: putative lipid II flippase FtsW [Clostridia bacterium]|nr:putative lipid II flippase FtsW [Clostridia bacterium]